MEFYRDHWGHFCHLALSQGTRFWSSYELLARTYIRAIFQWQYESKALKMRMPAIYPLEWLRLKRSTRPNVVEDLEWLELSYAAGRNDMGTIHTPYDPRVPLLGLRSTEMCMCVAYAPKGMSWSVPSSTVYTSEHWKLPPNPSTVEWINKLGYIYTMGFYPAVRTKELKLLAATDVTQACNIIILERF